jgi:hypothetical protein
LILQLTHAVEGVGGQIETTDGVGTGIGHYVLSVKFSPPEHRRC